MVTRRRAVLCLQWPGVSSFDAQLQQQPPKLFEQWPFFRAAATDAKGIASFQQQSPRLFERWPFLRAATTDATRRSRLQQQPQLFAAALLRFGTHTLVLGAANLFRAEPQLPGSVTLLFGA